MTKESKKKYMKPVKHIEILLSNQKQDNIPKPFNEWLSTPLCRLKDLFLEDEHISDAAHEFKHIEEYVRNTVDEEFNEFTLGDLLDFILLKKGVGTPEEKRICKFLLLTIMESRTKIKNPERRNNYD